MGPTVKCAFSPSAYTGNSFVSFVCSRLALQTLLTPRKTPDFEAGVRMLAISAPEYNIIIKTACDYVPHTELFITHMIL